MQGYEIQLADVADMDDVSTQYEAWLQLQLAKVTSRMLAVPHESSGWMDTDSMSLLLAGASGTADDEQAARGV